MTSLTRWTRLLKDSLMVRLGEAAAERERWLEEAEGVAGVLAGGEMGLLFFISCW